MRKIQKTISLEPMTSRLPSILPSYLDGKLYFFDELSLRIRRYEHITNWGMIPVNVVLDKKPDTHYGYGEYQLSSCNEEDEMFSLSFTTFSEWYYFFTEYYNLLNNYGHCNMVYSSATEYYNNESKGNYASQMIYGENEQTYIDLDNTFIDRGGSAAIEDGVAIDFGFYRWMCDNIVPRFTIPSAYVDYWNRSKLFYPDVVRWLAWFSQRIEYEDMADYSEATDNELETWNCKKKGIDNCCDCDEYFKRGGKRTYDKMVAWYDEVQENVEKINKHIKENIDCFKPTIIFPTELQNSVDDFGEFSIFSKDFKLGTDYRTVKTDDIEGVKTFIHYDEGNTNSGTVATMDGNSMILVSGSGFHYDETYMERHASVCNVCGYEGVFSDACPRCGSTNIDTKDWKSYTEKYIQDNDNEFSVREFTTYGFTSDNRKVILNDGDDADSLFAEVYEIDNVDSMRIYKSLYPIYENEYGIYDLNDRYLSGRTYYVYREIGTNTPYTIINGTKIYGKLYYSGGTIPVYYFEFFKKIACKKGNSLCNECIFSIDDYMTYPRLGTSDDKKRYIIYNGFEQEVVNDTVPSLEGIVDDKYIHKIDGTFTDKFGDTYHCYKSNIYKGDELPPDDVCDNRYKRITISNVDTIKYNDSYWFLTSETNFEESENGKYCIVYADYDIVTYSSSIITGKTVSKLYDLRSTELLTDDAGQTIEGIYNVRKNYSKDDGTDAKKYSQPPRYGQIEPIYQVGNTANLRRFKMTVLNEDEIQDGSPNYFVGDIITEMEFYYVYSDETPIEETRVSASTMTSSLDAIKESRRRKDEFTASTNSYAMNDIRCDITYYIGATLSRLKGEPYKLAESLNNGVKYTETVRFVKTEAKYYLRTPSKVVIPNVRLRPNNNNICFPIYIYVLTQDKTQIESKIYNTLYDVALANFETVTNIKKGESDEFEFDKWPDMANRNNLEVFPTFREEYKIGLSAIEKIDSNIYIDRGINASFEKHIKLGEVTSMESLEQFGNGYFKIING